MRASVTSLLLLASEGKSSHVEGKSSRANGEKKLG